MQDITTVVEVQKNKVIGSTIQFKGNVSQAQRGPIVISVEAAIGTGKSTLLRLVKEHRPNWTVVQEPVGKWQAVNGEHNLLEAFYSDPARHAFTFQTYCVISRIETVVEALRTCPDTCPVMIVERSWFSDRNTFAKMLIDSGKMSPMEAALYTQWYDFASPKGPKIHGHLYLECDSSTCMTRLKRRGRSEETAVTEEYQQDLIRHHEDWLATIDPRKVCRVNVDAEFASDEVRREQVFEQIHDFVTRVESLL